MASPRSADLQPLFASLGAAFGPTAAGNGPLHFGDARAEWEALTGGVALVDRSARPVVRVRGEDRVSFLHGMVTQDVKGISEPGAAYAAFLTPKGAMVADARILRLSQQLLLDTEPGRDEKILEFLNRYLISEDAVLDDASAEWAYLAVAGPRHRELLKAALGAEEVPAQPNGVASVRFREEPVWMVGSRGLGVAQVELLIPRQNLIALAERLTAVGASHGGRWAGFEATEAARVEAGVPRFGQDMEETTIPLEANLQSALHYSKGCYIGQEVIARATFRGHMNRKLVGLTFSGEPVAHKAELRRGDKKVGWVTSALRSPAEGNPVLGLGYVHRDHLEPGTELELADESGKATVRALPS